MRLLVALFCLAAPVAALAFTSQSTLSEPPTAQKIAPQRSAKLEPKRTYAVLAAHTAGDGSWRGSAAR